MSTNQRIEQLAGRQDDAEQQQHYRAKQHGAEQQQQPHACFVCLSSMGPLLEPCACTWLRAHRRCIARWCLQSAGKAEESRCRFCHSQLPDWRDAYAPPVEVTGGKLATTMTIHSGGRTHWVQVKPGAAGMDEFRDDVRRLLCLPPEQPFDVTFECRLPGEESVVELQGLHTYDAAVYCAALNAAERASQATQQAEDAALQPSWPWRRRATSTCNSGNNKSSHSPDGSDDGESPWSDVTAGVPLCDTSGGRMTWLARAILVAAVRLLDLLPL